MFYAKQGTIVFYICATKTTTPLALPPVSIIQDGRIKL
jgi:hypothetical protein